MPGRKQFRKQVLVPDGFVPQLMAIFDVSKMAVSKALNFRTDNEKAQKIRSMAVQKGGSLFDPAQHGYENRNHNL